jgi:hypothetical protein
MRCFTASIFAAFLSCLSLNANAIEAFVFQGEACVGFYIPEGEEPVEITGGVSSQGVAVDAGLDVDAYNAGKLTCSGYHEQPLNRAMVQPVACYFPVSPLGELFTENGRLVMSPSGNWTLFCKFDRAPLPQPG